MLISDITLSLPTIPSLLSRCTTTSQDLQRVKKLGILRSLPDASCASLHLARWEFSRVPETLPDPIISCVRIRNDFAVARWRCGNAEPAQEQEARERERKGGGGGEKSYILRIIRQIKRRPVALLFRTHRDMRSRVATRHGRKRARSGRHQKFREAYLHFNKRYYWMSRCGTTCSRQVSLLLSLSLSVYTFVL